MAAANFVLDSAALTVIVTAVGTVTKTLVDLAKDRGKYRAQAADEFVTASKRIAEYSTALSMIADLLADSPDGQPVNADVCRRVSMIARNALGYADRSAATEAHKRRQSSPTRRQQRKDAHSDDPANGNGDAVDAS